VEGDWYLLTVQVTDNDGNVAAKNLYLRVNNSDNTLPTATLDDFTQTSVGMWSSGQGPLNIDIAAGSISTATDILSVVLPSWITNGTKVMFAGASAPGGFTAATVYCVINNTGSTSQLSATSGGAAVDITSVSGMYDLVFGGHVEDPADSNHDGGADADLSGSVSIRGTVFDDTDVSSLHVEIDGADQGTAALSNKTGDAVLGYTYNWTFVWDTAKQGMALVAKDNVVVRVYGIDPANNFPTAGSRPIKTVDVVPYITSVTDPNGLSTDVLRGSTGKYSIGAHATNTLTVRGYNIGSSGVTPAVWVSPTAAVPTAGTAPGTTWISSNEVRVSKNLTRSGWLTALVSAVPSVNNVSRNDRARNIESNADPRSAQWSDDRYLWVWAVTQLNGAAFANKTYYYPDMVMSGNQPLFAFTDDNGGDTNRTTSDTAVTQRSGNRFQRQAAMAIATVNVTPQTFILTGQDTTQSGDNMGYLELTGFNDGVVPDAGSNVTNSWIMLEGSDYPAHVVVGANSSILRKTNRFPYPTIIAATNTIGANYGASIYTTFYDASIYYKSLNFVSFRTTAKQAGNYSGLPTNDNMRLTQVIPIPGTVGRASPYFDMVKLGSNGIAVAYFDSVSNSLKLAHSSNAFAVTGVTTTDNLPVATGQEKGTYTFNNDLLANYSFGGFGKYFTINSGTVAGTAYDVWFDPTGSSAAPAGSGAPNNIRVDISPTAIPTFNRTYLSIAVVNALRTVPAFADSEMGATGTTTQCSVVVVTSNGNVTNAAVGNLTSGTSVVSGAPATVDGAAANWGTTLTLDSSANVGQYLSMVTDGTKIYVAYYDYDEANLKVVRVSWNAGAPSVDANATVNIDNYLSAGTWTGIQLTADSSLTGQGTAQPFITFYADSYSGTKKPIRIAFPTFDATTGAMQHGVTGSGADDAYSGSWEIITVPAASVPKGGMEQFLHTNIGTYVGNTLNLPVVGWMADYIEYAKLQPNN